MTEAAPGGVATAAGSRRSASRLAWLDALRGFAALCVVFDHTTSIVLGSLHKFLYQWFDFGQYGVFVFFLVSGYIVPASLERKGSVRGFWISRAFRLYPLYLLAITASIVAYEVGYGTLRGGQHHPVGAVASWLLMMPNVLSGPNVPNVTWTLSYEMAFYLLLAGLFSVRAHRKSGEYALACGVIVVAVGGVLPMAALDGGSGLLAARNVDILADALIIAGIALSVRGGPRAAAGAWLAALTGLVLLTVNQDNYPLPWSGYTILAFMFTGTLLYRAERGEVAVAKAAVIAVAVLVMTVGGGLWHGAQHRNWSTSGAQWQWQWFTSLAGAAVTFGIGLALRNRRIPRFLSWLGLISFSVYLLHPLILDAFRDVPSLHHASKSSLMVQIPLALGLLAVVIAASAVSYYLLERPVQALGRRVARRWEPQAGADSSKAGVDGAGGTGVDAARRASISNAVAGGSGGSP